MELEVQFLSMDYGNKLALDRVSFRLTPGFYGILGPNGAGKSTLIKILTGSLVPTGGMVLLDSEPVQKHLPDYLRQIGYMPQEQALYLDFTAWEYLDYLAALKGMPKPGRAERIAQVLNEVELFENRNLRLRTYSGGMRQRALLAQALLNDPPLLILDEPMSGLDPGQRIRVRRLLQRQGRRSIVLMATHIVADIEAAAGKVLLLSRGHLVGFDTVEVLCQNFTAKAGQPCALEQIYISYCGGEVDNHDADPL